MEFKNGLVLLLEDSVFQSFIFFHQNLVHSLGLAWLICDFRV